MNRLLETVGAGHSSVAASQLLAESVTADNAQIPALMHYSTLGGTGTTSHAANTERDLHRWLKNDTFLDLEPYSITFPLYTDFSDRPVNIEISVIAPHELIYAMYKCSEELFNKCFLEDGNTDCILEYWENALEQPWGCSHPVAQDPSKLHRTIPLIVHVDGAEAYTEQEATVWSFGSPFAHNMNVFDTKFLTLLLINHDFEGTWNMVNRIVAAFYGYCFWALEIGEMPHWGFYNEFFSPTSRRGKKAGQAICGDFLFCFLGWTGDRKARKESHNFSRSRQH